MIKPSISILLFSAAATLLGSLAPAVRASDPQAPVASAYAEIQTIAREAADADAMAGPIDAVLTELVDYGAFAKRTLKSRWKGLSARQKKRFQRAFKALILRTYARRFKHGSTFEVSWRGTPRYLDDAKQLAEVRSTVTGKKAAADVDYLMVSSPKGWKAHDIIVDEVSMARNWRKQFKRILDEKGFDELVRRIEKKSKR
jgi:phospholipid transport system substrate-binding protein